MNERELTIDDLSSPYEEGMSYFAYGGPVGESMQSDLQPTVSYFAEGGEVADAQEILSRIPARPIPTMATSMPMPPRRTAAQMLQTFADGGTVETLDLPSRMDISKQVNVAGAPVNNLFGPTSATTSTASQALANIPTFNPTYTPGTGPINVIDDATASKALTGYATKPTITDSTFTKDFTPSAMVVSPTFDVSKITYTPTEQTFTKPVLETDFNRLQKEQPTMVVYRPDVKYGGVGVYKGPLQTDVFSDTITIPQAPVSFTEYAPLSNEQLMALSGKSDVTRMLQNAVNVQAGDVKNARAALDAAIAEGDITKAIEARKFLTTQEQELASAKTDLATNAKYFTGAGGTYETPEAFVARVGKSVFAPAPTTTSGGFFNKPVIPMTRPGPSTGEVTVAPGGIEGGYTKLDLGAFSGKTAPIMVGKTKLDPFQGALKQQSAEYNAARDAYRLIVNTYGEDSRYAKDFYTSTVLPEKADYDVASKASGTARSLYEFTNSAFMDVLNNTYVKPPPSKLEGEIINAYDGRIKTYADNIKTLETQIKNAQAAGLTGYVAQLSPLLDLQRSNLASATADRKTALDEYASRPKFSINPAAKAGSTPPKSTLGSLFSRIPAKRKAKGSPPEGEVADSRSRALLKKLSGGSEANTVPLQKFSKGGAVSRAQGSPVKGETVPTPPPAKDSTMSGIVSEASKFLKNLTSRSAPDSTLNMSQYEQMYALKDVGSPEKGRKAALNVYSSLVPALMRARFPDYVANSPARVLKEAPRGAQNVGEFDVFYRTIALDPEGTNSMLMEPYGKYGYIGMGSNTTTDETLNALGTMLHESMHARTRGAEGKKRSAPHPAEQLKKAMPKDRFDEMIRDIRVSDLPSVYSAPNPAEVINEYFATATPVKQMVDKDMVTKRSRRYLAEVDRLAKKYPELEKMRVTWERPELFFKD